MKKKRAPGRRGSKRRPAVTPLVDALTRAQGHAAREPIRARLRRLGTRASRGLVNALSHDDAFTRWEAVSLLGENADPATFDRLVEFALTEDEVHARWRSFWAVTRFDTAALRKRLLAELRGRNATRRWRAALILSMIGAAEAGPVLMKGLAHADEWVQWEALGAIKALRLAGAEDAIEPFVDPARARALRQEATLALGAIGSKRAVAALIGLLDDPETEVRWRAALALLPHGTPDVQEALRTRLPRETDATVRQQIEHTLKAPGAEKRETGS
jgi:HEAT repeat protein